MANQVAAKVTENGRSTIGGDPAKASLIVRNKHPEFKQEIDTMLLGMVQRFYREVEGADHLFRSDDINLDYYRRHIIEIILRLRMKRWIDALTIHYFTKNNPLLAKKWCSYIEDEMLHDSLFVKDLERVGVDREEIYSTEPMFTTKLLQGYFYYGLEHEGVPLASLSSSYFIENVSLMTQPDWIENSEKSLGSGMAKGQRAHVEHDLEDDHTHFVWDVLMTFVDTEDDKRRVIEHISNVYKLFCAFYSELYQRTIKGSADDSAIVEILARPRGLSDK